MSGRAIFGCSGPILTAQERAFFAAERPFGFILFARNIAEPVQVRALTSALRDAVGYDAPIFIDQEGGRVQRLGPPHWRDWPAPLDMVQSCRDPLRAMWLRGRMIADELRALGIDGNCVPNLDIADRETHPFLRNRCYGETPAQIIPLARALCDAHKACGVLPVMKHIPGHGRAVSDSHKDLPRVDTKADMLKDQDFAPFRALNDLPFAMTAHILYTALDAENCATQSETVIRMIRDDIGFGGLLMSDDLNMQALSGDLAQRTRRSLAAGCDIALHCSGVMEEMIEVAAACAQFPQLDGGAVAAALGQRFAPELCDIPALAAEFRSLTEIND